MAEATTKDDIADIPLELAEPLFQPQSFADRKRIEEVFRTLRTDYPLNQAKVPGYDPHWIVTRMADLKEIARQDDIFLSAERSKTLISQAGEQLVLQYTGGDHNLFHTLVQMDAPEHRKYRAVTNPSVSLASVRDLRPVAEEIAAEFVDKLAAAQPTCDFTKTIAFHYPLKVILTILGVPEKDHAMMLRLTHWLFTYADPDMKRPGSDPTDPEEITRTWKIVIDEFEKYYRPFVAERQRCPMHDLGSVIANGEIDGGPLEETRLLHYLIIVSTAGHDTTAAATGTAMWILAERPDLLKELKADPSLIPGFVDETIRWATPVQVFVRTAAQDYDISGRTIRKGDRVYLSYLSANRDEETFADPDKFDAHRKPNRHVGFGFGAHTCLGIHLARMELIVFWETLLPRLESVELDGAPKMTESEFVCGPKSVPIRFSMT